MCPCALQAGDCVPSSPYRGLPPFHLLPLPSMHMPVSEDVSFRVSELQSLHQFFALFLIAWFSKQSEHILLVALNARLVERINAE